MTVTRLEHLPNELWFELFIYFTWSELESSWIHWKLNSRIQILAEIAQNRVALSLSSMSFTTYDQCLHYFEHEHPIKACRITSLLLNESIVSNEIINRWLENEKSFLPRIRKCTIYIDRINRYVRTNIILLIRRHTLTIRHIVFYFNGLSRYSVILKYFIEQCISVHTMEFIVIKDKNELITFKDCIKTIMIHLHRLHFILYLPVQTRLDDIDLYWFNLDHHTVEYEINEVIFLYTIPYLLNSQRRVYNNSVAQQSTINNNITHIEWIIDHDLLSIAKTLLHFEHVKSLHLFFNMTEMKLNPDSWHMILPFLRSLRVNFQRNPMQSRKLYNQSVTPNLYRYILLEQFRQYEKIPSPYLTKRLPTNEAFPQLQYLSFGGRRFSLTPPKKLANRILLCFDSLVSSSKFIILHVNRCCGIYRSVPSTSRDILMTLLTECVRSRNLRYSSSKIIIDSNEEIIIWL
ncbi:unnamed protein product [Rotaria sp. Silwood2]|nr:unnamed protein product [Rotaria sp. Silwood2]